MLTIKEPERLYRELGRLIQEAPAILFSEPLTQDQIMWLGRARTLIQAGRNPTDSVNAQHWTAHIADVSLLPRSRKEAFDALMAALIMTMAAAEYEAPAAARGSFIPVGSSFDAFAAISKVLAEARKDVLIVDPYLDEVVLTDFAPAVLSGVTLRLMADQKSHKPTLQPAATRWVAQHGTNRPLQVRLAAPGALHDRAIFIDGTTAYAVTQSLKDLAKRSPAEIVRADDTAALKIAAYETIWSAASVVV